MPKRKTKGIDQEVGALIKQRRARGNISQQALGEVLGLSFQQIQKYEKGVNRMSVAAFVESARAFGARPSDLMLELESRL